MGSSHGQCLIGLAAAMAFAGSANAAILGQHHFTWWDDPGGIIVTPQGAPPPTMMAVQLLDLDEWHLDQADTTRWYNGQAVAGLPANPFNAANRTGLTPGSAIVPVNNAEAFIYRITNVNYGQGNGFSFSTPPGNLGINDLSGINLVDQFNALLIDTPAPGSQFIFTNVPFGILDLTPTAVNAPGPNDQDWVFNAFNDPNGNFEWDIEPDIGGGVISLDFTVFGFAMPGRWTDAVSHGWVHSWSMPGPGGQVNIADALTGFSGPEFRIEAPPPPPGVLGVPALSTPGLLLSALLLGLAGLAAGRRKAENTTAT